MRVATTLLLTDENISNLRSSAQQSQRRRFGRPCVPMTFRGGPLHGLKIIMLQYESTGAYLTFCVVTEQGQVQVQVQPRRAIQKVPNK